MTLEDYIERRNAIQLKAENASEERAKWIWIELGVANRHIERVLTGQLKLSEMVEREITNCLERVSAL